MKSLITAIAYFIVSMAIGQNSIELGSKQSIELSFPDTPNQFYSLKNTSKEELTISIINKVSGAEE